MTDARTTVVLEAPGRVAATLADLAQADPQRPVAVVRELTKVHEEVWRGPLGAAADAFAARQLRGEVVLVVGGAPSRRRRATTTSTWRCAPRWPMTRRPARARWPTGSAATLGVPRRRAYEATLRMRAGEGEAGSSGCASSAPVRYRRCRAIYLTTPIYYVNDAPHVGTAYTTVNADALARWHRLVGDDVWFLTGTDEHGAKIAEVGGGEHDDAPGRGRTGRRPATCEAWRRLDISYDDFIRTTEPRHYAVGAGVPAADLRQRVTSSKGVYSGLYCVCCEDYYTEDQLVDGKCPVHGTPGRRDGGGELLLQAERLRGAGSSSTTTPTPTSSARLQAQRGARLHQGRPARHLHHPDLVHLGRAGAVGQRSRLLRLVRRAHQLPDGGRLRRRRGEFAALVAGRRTTSSARRSCGSTACGGRRCAWRPASSRRPRSSCTAGC